MFSQIRTKVTGCWKKTVLKPNPHIYFIYFKTLRFSCFVWSELASAASVSHSGRGLCRVVFSLVFPEVTLQYGLPANQRLNITVSEQPIDDSSFFFKIWDLARLVCWQSRWINIAKVKLACFFLTSKCALLMHRLAGKKKKDMNESEAILNHSTYQGLQWGSERKRIRKFPLFTMGNVGKSLNCLFHWLSKRKTKLIIKLVQCRSLCQTSQ